MQSLLNRVLLNPSAACLASGYLLGQVVLALAARHQHQFSGLAFALVFVLAGAASMALFLKHWHAERRPAGEKAPLEAWLVLLGLALLASIGLPPLF